MKIRRSYELFAVGFTLLFIIIGFATFKALRIQADLVHNEQHRFRSFQLAVELFQSSEDLTRMARSYVSTGNPVYEKHYFEILDIRNGKLPRPAHYTATYWHLAGAGRRPIIATGELVALQDLMRREGFTEREFSLLRKSQENSDRLVIIEKQAFAAVKGLYDDGQGNFTVRRAPDRDYATSLLFSEKYFDEKARVMAPLQQCMDTIDERTKAKLSASAFMLRQYILLVLVLILIALLGLEIKLVHTFRMILLPIERLRKQVAEISAGNYAARCDVLSSNEIGELCSLFNNMAGILETDIFKRKQAEEELRRKSRFLSELIEHSGTLICVKDRAGRYKLVNRKWEETTGLKRHNTIGRTDEELFPGTVGRQFRENDLQVMESGLSQEKEETLEDEHGKRFFISIKFPLRRDDGMVEGICGMMNEITKRKQAQAELALERQRLASILEGTNVGTWEWNVQTGETTFNERWAEIIGYTLAELAPISIDTWVKFAHPDDIKTSDALLEKHFNKELPYYECESRMHHKDGSWVWVLDRGKLATRTHDGKPLVMSGTHQDITARKMAEERLNYMERIFLHDITNTAVALRGFADLMMAGSVDKDMEKKFMPSVSFLSNRIIDEIAAHRQLTAAEDKSLVVKSDNINSLSFLTDLYNTYNRVDMLESRELKVDEAAQSVDFISDKTLLGRVIGNMIKNAIEASLPGEKVTMGCFAKDNRINFWVHNPAYMPENIRAQLFNRSFSTKGVGRGLGTYSMKFLTEQYLQGRISFVSTKDKGTTFTAEYPIT